MDPKPHEKPRDLQEDTWPDVDDPEHPSPERPGAPLGHREELLKSETDQPPSRSDNTADNGRSDESSDKGPL